MRVRLMNTPCDYFYWQEPGSPKTIVPHWDPPMLIVGKLAAIAVLVALNAFFVAANFPLVKVRTSSARRHAGRGQCAPTLLRAFRGHLNAYLSATQLGITMASLGLGWIGEQSLASNHPAGFRFFAHLIARGDKSIVVRSGFRRHHVFAHRVRANKHQNTSPFAKPLPVCAVRLSATARRWFYVIV